MTTFGHILPTAGTHRVVILVPAGAQLIGVIGVLEAFDAANRFLAAWGQPPLYTLALAGVEAETPCAAGPRLCTRPAARIRELDTLVVGGSLDTIESGPSTALLRQTARLADRAERLVAVCAGAFVLAELGWLDGRRCTSHWLGLEQLRERYPQAEVLDDALFTEDEGVFTSAGASAGIDLALHLIRSDGGHRLALAVARALVVFAMRPGGQSQFGSALRLRPLADERLRELVTVIHAHPAKDHSVPCLARRVGMSPRHFARVFREQTGQTPGAYVAAARVEAAQRALAHSDASIPTIAEACGFGHDKSMRRAFVRVVGVTPSAWRRRFGAAAP